MLSKLILNGFVCSKEIRDCFGAAKFFTWEPPPVGVTEVVLLDLSSMENRATFLGLEPGSVRARAVEMVLEKATPELMTSLTGAG